MACDLVFASERSTFEWAYAKTGLSGAESSTFFVPRLVGLRFAAEMLLLNPRLDAVAARSAGLVNGVFPVSGFELEALVRSADSAEFAEGIEAFFGRRTPRFPGAG